MSLSHSGSIHVVTKDARFSRGLPSSISSSLMIWYAASLGIDRSGIRYLRRRVQSQSAAPSAPAGRRKTGASSVVTAGAPRVRSATRRCTPRRRPGSSSLARAPWLLLLLLRVLCSAAQRISCVCVCVCGALVPCRATNNRSQPPRRGGWSEREAWRQVCVYYTVHAVIV
jgi:hypothetical protein